jgi:uncharacterized protein YndB with AHSA1/START domain
LPSVQPKAPSKLTGWGGRAVGKWPILSAAAADRSLSMTTLTQFLHRMPQTSASASALIHAPPDRVYQILADYRQHHLHIVPPEYFRKVEVEEGGVGAGTRIRVEMRVLGTTKHFVHSIREPEPGRVLEETDDDGTSTTTFTVDRLASDFAARVTIQTTFTVRSGMAGRIEGVLSRAMLARIYRRELARLDAYARKVQ